MINAGDRQLPNPTMPKMPKGNRTIVSVYPRSAFNKVFSFIQAEMPAPEPCLQHNARVCRACKTHATYVVTPRVDPINDPFAADGSGRRLHPMDADEVAESLLVDGCLDRGVFVAAGDKPTDAELDAAYDQLAAWGTIRVNQMDEVYARDGARAQIDPLAIEMAKFLGLTRDWLQDISARVDCLNCGESSKKGIISCKCGFPVDWEVSRTLGKLTPQMEAFAIGKGLLTPAHEEPVRKKTASL